MSPQRRRVLQAILYEVFAVAFVTPILSLAFDEPATSSFGLAVTLSSIALTWNYVFNSLFERWEARQTKRGRSLARRLVHGIGFEGGLVILFIPVMALWLKTSALNAFLTNLGLLVFFFVYAVAFTWVFDRVFGLPESAAEPNSPTKCPVCHRDLSLATRPDGPEPFETCPSCGGEMDSNAGRAGLRHEAFISRAKIAENAHSTASAHAFAMQALPASATELLALRKLGRGVDQRWVEWAVAMLGKGYDTPSLRRLAGESPPFNQFEMAALVDATFGELELSPFESPADAAVAYASILAQHILDRVIPMNVALWELAQRYVQRSDVDGDQNLHDFYLLHYALDDLRDLEVQNYWPKGDRETMDEVIRDYCRTWLGQHPLK